MNNIISNLNKNTLIGVFLFLSIGCGGGGSNNNNTDIASEPATGNNQDPSQPSVNEPRDARVTAMSMEKPIFGVGSSSLVSVDVTYALTRVRENGERVALVVKLPAGLAYAIDSSGIRTSTSSANAVPVSLPCSDGSSFLAYDLGGTELNNSQDPDGREDADFELIFVVDGISTAGVTVITAGASDNSLSYSCDKGYEEEASTGVTVN